MFFADIIAFVCSLNDFALKPGTLLLIMNTRNHKGDTPVHNATQNNNIDCLAALLERGADLNAEGSFGFRVAHFATRDRYPDTLRYVLQHGADPNIACASGDTPGHFAARNRDMFCLRALREGGADLRGYNSKWLLREYLVCTRKRLEDRSTIFLFHSTPMGVFLHYFRY